MTQDRHMHVPVLCACLLAASDLAIACACALANPAEARTARTANVDPVHARWTPTDSALPDPGDRESLSWRGKDYPAYGFCGWYTQASGGTRVGGAGDAFRVDATSHDGYLANGSTIHAR